jgi:hypothetical protein
MNCAELKVNVSDGDADVVLVFPDGQEMVIQLRPSNADTDYNGTMDIILPRNQSVVNWIGENMEEAPAMNPDKPHIREARHLYTELPYDLLALQSKRTAECV